METDLIGPATGAVNEQSSKVQIRQEHCLANVRHCARQEHLRVRICVQEGHWYVAQ
jgi:hypothetical protein